jgi:4a-hydroxytetrahydrobiopterin dehydratase
MVRPAKLDEREIRERLANLSGWSVAEGKLHREFRFKDFRRAFGFMTSLALVAESLDHHPDWSNVYNRVTVDLSTHDAGGITELDFRLAAAADELYGQ